MRWTKSLLNFFYPNRCPACSCLISAHELLCAECADKLLLGQDDYCHICGKVACICKRTVHAYDKAVVCSAYADGAIPAIIGLKKSENTNFAIFAAKILASRLEYGAPYYKQIDCAVPVPMHRTKQRMRGYNQAALIAKETARLLGVPVREDILTKQRGSIEQHKLSYAERTKNVESFGIRDCQLNGMRILLCDDVLTTGNTMHRCAELLKEKGASAVIAAAAATTVPKVTEAQNQNTSSAEIPISIT